jgi:hypothetical protein
MQGARDTVKDSRQSAVGIDDLRATLDIVAADLRDLWTAALSRADFSEVTRLVEVSHAVHRAIVCLGGEQLISPPPGS